MNRIRHAIAMVTKKYIVEYWAGWMVLGFIIYLFGGAILGQVQI